MIENQNYIRVLTSICAALTTLLGSVGIFVSLTVQRRVERLQDILEEFLDFSYHSDTNITGKIYKLIEKYQMHYLFPDTPGRTILQYLNLTIILVVVLWCTILTVGFHWTLGADTFLYLTPILFALGILLLYRYLLKSFIYPFGNNLMSPLIPPPIKLRSVSYLSRYVNVSVKSLLRQARLRLLIKNQADGKAIVLLKEELSFDDYFYYMLIFSEDKPIFLAFGDLIIDFGNEAITGKPIPVAKNVSIPLGYIPTERLSDEGYTARFFILARGEKHPLEYLFNLKKQGNVYTMSDDPEISVNYMMTYQIHHKKFEIIEENAEIPFFREMARFSSVSKKRFACCEPFSHQNVSVCKEDIFID